MAKVYYDADADITQISGETVSVIGYGIQGRAQSLNMRDSGLSVIVGNRDDEYGSRAQSDGFKVFGIDTATRQADIIIMLIPDEIQAEIYRDQIEKNLKKGNAIVFAHGFSIRYGLIQPPDHVDCLLVAPRMPGAYVRDFFLHNSGVPAFVDVKHDATGRAWRRTLGLAKAIGATRAGAMAISFAEETELDHFSEHFIYPLIIGALTLSYEVLIENGYPPEAAVMELYGSRELGEVLIEAAKIGLYQMVEKHASPACQYGIHSYSRKLLSHNTRTQIQKIIDEIKAGTFAAELLDEQRTGYRKLKQMRMESHSGPLSAAEASLRQLIQFRDRE
ncbi:MAG TPA: ketol-acid reductoisomerase [Candidatus Binatia bacterium]|nr:ketol-acid reductoisomerase [Candidatus Binatia bacterium]